MNIATRLGRVLALILVILLLSQVTVPFAIAATVSCTIVSDTRFVPSWGAAEVAQDQYSRYIFQWMYWHNDDRLYWFKNNVDSTYEPDAFFYNHDLTAYGDRPSGYWGSDLPSPYVDTQLGDGWEEKAVTIGSAGVSFVRSAVVYYTVTRMVSGGGSSSWTKLSSQRGRRVPSSCYSTNCSFGCDNGSIYQLVPFRDFTAPGCRQYWWKWDDTLTAPC